MDIVTKAVQSLCCALIKTGIPLKLVTLKLKREMNRCYSIKDYVNLAFNFKGPRLPLTQWSIRPLQVKEEITKLLEILVKRRPRFVLEIGTARGGTLFLFSRVAAPNATLISIDIGYSPFRQIPLYNSFASSCQKIYFLCMDSHEETTLLHVKKILSERRLDFLFIDGDHRYESVKKDFEMYGKLVRAGGLIAFHDIVPRPAETKCRVNKFWLGIKDEYEHLEIVRNWGQNDAGIGVIYV